MYDDVLVKWQPRFGRVTTGGPDSIGLFFEPLILIDQRFIHSSISILTDAGLKRAQHLPRSLLQP